MGVTIAMAGGAAVILGRMFKTKHFIKSLLMSAVQGIFALFAVNAVGIVSGVTIAVNNFTVAVSCIGGVPGVILLLLMRLLSGI